MKPSTISKLKSPFWRIFPLLTVVLGFVPGSAGAATLSVPGDHATIAEAITAASNGDTINVAAGTYSPSTTLAVDKELVIAGAGSGSTTIDVGGFNAWGVYISADNVSFSGFTITGDAATNLQYPVKVGSGNATPGAICSGIVMSDLVVQDGDRSGIDVNGCDGVTLSGITSTGAASGFGLAISSSANVSVTDLTTSGNAWGDVAVFPAATVFQWPALESPTAISFAGTLSLSAGVGAITVQDGALASGGTWTGTISTDPADSADVTVPASLSHRIDTTRISDGLVSHIVVPGALAGPAAGYLLGLGTLDDIVVQDMINEDFEVFDGLSIQAAIDASSDGDTINVGPGTYTNGAGNCSGPQQYALSIEKEISLVGAGADYDPAVGSVFAPYSCGGQASNGVVYIAADNVTVSGLALEGQTNLDSASGQTIARGFQTAGPLANLLVDDVAVNGTSHSCFEFNGTSNSTARDVLCDMSLADYNGGVSANGFRVVENTDLLIENYSTIGNSAQSAPGGGSGYYLVSFQDFSSYTLKNLDLSGGAADFGHYIYMAYEFDGPSKDQEVTYDTSVTIADVPVGIRILEDAGATLSLVADPGVISFSNVDVPLFRDGTGSIPAIQEFTCNAGITWQVTDGAAERYFATQAEADAWALANGGTVAESGCCGDGTFNPAGGEQCDDGANNDTFGSCCTSTCTFRDASTLCRNDGGQCDVADYCSGSSDVCVNQFEADTVSCTGASQAGICDDDASDFCLGTADTCVDGFVAAGTECRVSTGQCDVAEQCTGASGSCPVDAFQPDTTPCTGASQGDACDEDASDRCSGTADVCVDAFRPATFVCRAGSGDPNSSGFTCDPDETCDGSTASCPADQFSSAGTVCNSGSGSPNGGDVCDPDEVCPGTAGGACPLDTFSDAATVCNAGGGDPNGSGFTCDPTEYCPGVADGACPTDSFSASTVVCNAGSGNPDGGDVCDPDEYCPGTADTACPSDTIVAADTPCREAIGECDLEEKCSGAAGVACAADAFFDDGLACYTDPYLEDPPNREAPESPLPCVGGDCTCDAGLCVAPGGFTVGTARFILARPGSASGKVRVTGVLQPIQEGGFTEALLAGEIALTAFDGDSSFSVVEPLSNCVESWPLPNRPIYKCRWDGGTAVFKRQLSDPNLYDVKILARRLDDQQTGSTAIDVPLTIAVSNTTFYGVNRSGEISDGCSANRRGTGMVCR